MKPINLINPTYIPEKGAVYLPPAPPIDGKVATPKGVSLYGWNAINYGVPEMHELGFLGERLYIVIADSGVNPLERFNGAVIAREDFTGENEVNDLHSHGTFIASQLVSRHDMDGYKGLTPKALVHSKRLLDKDTLGYDNAIISALGSCLDIPMETGRFYMLNNSFGGWYNKQTHEIIKELVAKGWHVFNAAGNTGTGGMTYPAGNRIGYAIGASDASNQIANFSARPIEGQDLDILSCGVNVAGYVKDGRQSHWSGSSMAAPDALGKFGLMLEMDYQAARKIYVMPPIRKELALELFTEAPAEEAEVTAGVFIPQIGINWIMSNDELLPNEVPIPIDDGDEDEPTDNDPLRREFTQLEKWATVGGIVAFFIAIILMIIFGKR